jgi:uncharacterized membrane protein YvlD (DUF360 family)
MAEDKTARRANGAMKLAFRVFINVALVLFLRSSLGAYFVLEGGAQAIAITALLFTALNMLVVPVLNVLSLPIKLFAWIVAFVLVNIAAVWIAVWIMDTLAISGVSLAIEGGVVGWFLVSATVGVGNWLVKAIVK